MKLYLSGPMTGLPDFNRQVFCEAAAILRSVGFDVWSPAECGSSIANESWESCMRECIASLLECDWLVQLPGWEASKGASLEYQIAAHLGLNIASWEMLRNHSQKIRSFVKI